MVQGQVYLKGGGGLALFLFNLFSRFIIFTFRNYSLPNCVMHLKKNHSFMKKVILSCLKMNLKISHKLNLIYLYIKGF